MKKIIITIITLSNIYAVYNVGDIVTNSDQNIELNVCDANSQYSIGDPIRLSDWNGDINGGDYHVIWLEMSASW